MRGLEIVDRRQVTRLVEGWEGVVVTVLNRFSNYWGTCISRGRHIGRHHGDDWLHVNWWGLHRLISRHSTTEVLRRRWHLIIHFKTHVGIVRRWNHIIHNYVIRRSSSKWIFHTLSIAIVSEGSC
jgi:hypothetical protein